MHCRNPYRHGINYDVLTKDVAPMIDLKPYLKPADVESGPTAYDIGIAGSPIALLKALLLRDFQLHIRVPDNRLCPAVPPRLDYVLWIQDIISSTRATEKVQKAESYNIIDIGTGASLIYPLLGCKVLSSNSCYVGTEVDQLSVDCAVENARQNKLESRVQILKTDIDGPLLPPALWELHDSFAALMCNPPLYSSAEEMQAVEASKNRPRIQALLGAPVETLTPGGATGFILRLVKESLEHKHRVGWFSSLCGYQEIIERILLEFRTLEIKNYVVAKFEHGKTTRWAIAWSFPGDRNTRH